MSTQFYKSTIGAMIRQAEALAAIMTKGREHLGADADTFINESLCADMLPFTFQIRSVYHSTAGNLDALRSGQAGPPEAIELNSYADLEALLSKAIEALKAVTPEELDGLLDKDVVFAMGDFKIPFKGLGFMTSFALPNFYFHTTTAYNLLRQKGVQIGKRDYLGAMDLNMG